jgi:hypothetical protein
MKTSQENKHLISMSCKVYVFLVKKSYNKQELTYIIVIIQRKLKIKDSCWLQELTKYNYRFFGV